MQRGELWWASMRAPKGSGPGFRRPVVVIQANEFTQSRLATVLCAVVTSNERLAMAPGNVRLGGKGTGVRSGSVIDVSKIATLNKSELTDKIGRLSKTTLEELDTGLRLVLAL